MFLYISFPISVVSFFSVTDMTTKTIVFKWTRELSREGITTSSMFFSELDKSTYYIPRIVRPHYVAIISNYEAINEFSLATSTFDMSFAVWLVLFIYKGKGSDYCHNPPGNIFHLRFGSEMLVRCGTENILREWYSLDGNQTEIDDLATWSLEKGITKMTSDSIYDRRFDLRGLVMRAVIVKDSSFVEIVNGKLDGIFGRISQELCDTLNFSFSIVSIVNEYGTWNQKENTWTGAVGEVYAGRADIAISDISMTSERLDVVDFTFPLLLSKNNIYIREPEIFAIQWSSYFLHSRNPLLQKLMKLMLAKEDLTSNILEGFKKICQNRKLALYTSAEVYKTVGLKIPCNVVPIEAGRVDCLSMILTKHNQFTNVINFHLEKFINNGMMNRLKDMSFKKKLNEIVHHKPVRITSVISLLCFIKIGIILGICILIFEKFIFSRKTKKNILMTDSISSKKSSKLHKKRKTSIKGIPNNYGNRNFMRTIKY
ncbi:hypothetical protein M0802_013724 [Mischocyttarus mexicanus]|nr:hypothetical protein M0802_013724 [Mischocyttarus mexicanus]